MKKLLVLIGLCLCVIVSGCGSEIEYKNIMNAKVGDFTRYGYYDGAPVVWKVVDVKNTQKKLMSWYVLDVKPFNVKENRRADWQHCSIRKWLNDVFLSTAFNMEEQGKLQAVERRKNVFDKVFLLNKNEVELYFDSINDRCCLPTKNLSKRNGYYESRDNAYWIDTENNDSELVRIFGRDCYWNYFVTSKGQFDTVLVGSPMIEFIEEHGVRPVVLVDVSK